MAMKFIQGAFIGYEGSGSIRFRHHSYVQPTPETWYWTGNFQYGMSVTTNVDVNFTDAAGNEYKRLYFFQSGSASTRRLMYYTKAGNSKLVWRGATGWADEAYRTITFDEPVTDTNLLRLLEENAVKE